MKHIVIIGGGIAGIEAACALTDAGHWVTVIEKNEQLGGKLNNWSYLFPDFTPTEKITGALQEKCREKDFSILNKTEVSTIHRQNGKFSIKTSGEQHLEADALVVATGYEIFDARRKEEYGYKIYDHVITSADLEQLLLPGGDLTVAAGNNPKRIAFVHCVGSRDEKTGNHYCSKVCCITGVKQAIELKKRLPEAEIYCFYMDLRMYGKHFEELYREAQEKYDIQFIRGRLSEASEKIDKSLLIKSEDTLSGRPLKMNVDLLVLLVGMEAGKGTTDAAATCGIGCEESGFLKTTDSFLKSNFSEQEGIFLAGSCTAPMTINDTISHARSAAMEVDCWLKKKPPSRSPEMGESFGH
ncbi:MAG: FAD-dependent oxidoreductase [Bacteroidota bacterium]|nr:FAD-dependent oxidoreductase [Bacteroidota bacterium]